MKRPIHLYNTLSHSVEPFTSLRKHAVGMYTCGPTVYKDAHIGNFRTYIAEDVLRRTLVMNHFRVHHVMNITDVGHLTSDADSGEDKVEAEARALHQTANEITHEYTRRFLRDCLRLHLLPPEVLPKATEHIPEQIALIQKLEKGGYTYRTTDGIYFDTAKFPNYGKLANLKGQKLKEGARVEKNTEKKHGVDFALWKFSPTGGHRQMEWPSPWGVGFPGWHIECSAMSMKYLGETFDVHASGIDHIPTHHTNEIAQSEAATGKPFAHYWFHVEFLRLSAGRMGKSEGNAITVSELIDRGYDPLAFRYLCLMTHYRKPLAFSWKALDGAQSALHTLYDRVRAMPKPKVGCAEYEERFRHVLNDDLNTPKALAIMWELMKSDYPDGAKHRTILFFDTVLGLGLGQPPQTEIPKEIMTLAAQREAARHKKDFAAADALRKKIEELGYTTNDTTQGTVIVPR